MILSISMGLSGSRQISAGLDRFLRVSASQRVSAYLGGSCGLTGFKWFSVGFGISKGLIGLGEARHLSGSRTGLDSLSGSRQVSWGLERI